MYTTSGLVRDSVVRWYLSTQPTASTLHCPSYDYEFELVISLHRKGFYPLDLVLDAHQFCFLLLLLAIFYYVLEPSLFLKETLLKKIT